MLRFKQITGIVFNTFFFAVMPFVPAGTMRWPRAWIFLGVVLVGTAVTMFVLPEELLNERYKPPVQRGQPLFDQIGIFAFVGSFVAAVLLIPFDVFRLHLLRPPGIVTSLFGLALFAAGGTLITVAMRANAFAVPVVHNVSLMRHITERRILLLHGADPGFANKEAGPAAPPPANHDQLTSLGVRLYRRHSSTSRIPFYEADHRTRGLSVAA